MNVLLVPHVGEKHLAAVVGALADASDFGWRLHVQPIATSVTAYWESLARWWEVCAKARKDLLIVEHDVVVHDDALRQFDECTEPMCAFTYWLGNSYGVGLGCTRFRSPLIRMNRDAVERAGRLTTDGLPVVGHWKRMDTRMWQVLGPPHVHEPPVRHLHDYPTKEPCASDSTSTER